MLDICNRALDHLKGGSVKNVTTPSTETEILLRRWYDKSRKKVLRYHPWNFAIKRAVLAASSTSPAFGYTAQYPLPTDCLRVLTLQTDDGVVIDPQDYDIENGAILYNADSGQLRLQYTYDCTDTKKFDALFTDLLELEIALGVGYRVTGQSSDVQRIAGLIKEAKPVATAVDGQEKPPRRVRRSATLTARRSGFTDNPSRIIY